MGKETKIIEILNELKLFFEQNNSDEKISKFSEKLSEEFDIEQIKSGVRELIRTRVFPTFPTFAEIRNCCINNSETQKEIQMTISLIKKAAIVYGANRRVKFDVPKVQKIVEKIGWSNICLMPEAEMESKVNSLYFQNDNLESINLESIEDKNKRLIEIKVKKYFANSYDVDIKRIENNREEMKFLE